MPKGRKYERKQQLEKNHKDNQEKNAIDVGVVCKELRDKTTQIKNCPNIALRSC